MSALELQDLTRRFSPGGDTVVAVDGLDLSVSSGEMLALVGPSGCGKTTLLRLIAGLERPDSGRIILAGKSAEFLPPEKRGVAMVFQHDALYPHMTVRQNLEAGLKWRKLADAERGKRVDQVVELLGLSPFLSRLPENLSGGERQRVALGRALALKPGVLLMDEPLSHLDAPARIDLRREIARINRELKTTMIYVTHDQAEALALGDRVAVMESGKIRQVGPPREVHDQPAHLFVAGFVGVPPINCIPGEVEVRDGEPWFLAHAARFSELLLAGLPSEIAGQVTLCLRPHLLSLNSSTDKLLCSLATLNFIEEQGRERWYVVSNGSQSLTIATRDSLNLQPGDLVDVYYRPEGVHLFDSDHNRIGR